MARLQRYALWAIVTFYSINATGQVTYHWISGNGSWETSSNWTPTRTTPSPTDQLIVDVGNSITISNVPTQVIQSLTLSNNTTVNLIPSGSSKTINISGTLTVDPGSRLNVSGVQGTSLTSSQDEGDDAPTFSVQDGGNNTIIFKFSKNRNTLFNSARILGMGSSTMYGSGATTGFKLAERLKAWVQTNIPGGEFFNVSENGLYSNHFVPDGETAESRWSKNILAALDMEPDIIVLNLPTNDIAYQSIARFMANLQRIDEVCKQRNVHLFVTTTGPRNDYSVAQQQLLYDAKSQILTHFGSRAIDVFTSLADPYTPQSPARIRDIYNADNIHPNNAGHGVIADLITSAWTNYFIDPSYNQYIIERSTNPTSGFSAFAVIGPAATTYTAATQNGEMYYYRLRAETTMDGYTEYSPVVSLQQPMLGGAVNERIQINFSNQANQQTIPQWNEFIPSGGVADIGESKTNLTNVAGQITTVGIVVTGTFPGVSSSGGRAGVFPANVIRTSWTWGGNVSADKPALQLIGLEPNTLYNVKCLFSTLATADYRYVGVDCQGKGKAVSANDPVVGSNDATTADLFGLQSSSTGDLELRFRALPTAAIGYLNALIIERVTTTWQGLMINIALQPGASADVGGTINMIAGTFYAENNTLILHSNASPLVKVSGNFSFGPGTVLQVGKTLTAGPNIRLADNILTGSGETSVSKLVMQNTNGLTLGNQPLTVRDKLELNDGKIATNTVGRLRLEPTALPVEEKVNSQIEGYVELKSFNAGSAEINFMGLKILAGTDNLGNVTILRKTGAAGINTVSTYRSIAATWDIDAQFQPVSGRQISLTWFKEFDNGNSSNNRFKVYRSSSTGAWEEVGPLTFLSQVTADSRTTTAVTATHFSSWTTSEEFQPLPLVWKEIYAEADNNTIHVHWGTLSEFNTRYFDVEKMLEEKSFVSIGQQEAAGTSNTLLKYSFTDSKPFEGLNYYRIKQIDLDGQYTYSKVVSTNFKSETNKPIVLYPNPVEGVITVKSYLSSMDNGQINLVDQFGKLTNLGTWRSDEPISIKEKSLAPGIYTVIISSDSGQYCFRVVVL